MLKCQFCNGNSSSNYLFLTCKHLCCLPCAYLHTDFSSLKIQCCSKQTKIDESSMEMIICSKRINKISIEEKTQNLPTQTKYQFDQQKVNEQVEIRPVNKQSRIGNRSQIYEPQIAKRNQVEERQNQNQQFENILFKQIENVKKGFQTQRQILKEQEQNTIKELISTFETEVKNIQKPISQAKLQKLNISLTKRSNFTHRKTASEILGQQIIQHKNQNKSKECYDHIVKRLEANQQRMKEKLQRHFENLY